MRLGNLEMTRASSVQDTTLYTYGTVPDIRYTNARGALCDLILHLITACFDFLLDEHDILAGQTGSRDCVFMLRFVNCTNENCALRLKISQQQASSPTCPYEHQQSISVCPVRHRRRQPLTTGCLVLYLPGLELARSTLPLIYPPPIRDEQQQRLKRKLEPPQQDIREQRRHGRSSTTL